MRRFNKSNSDGLLLFFTMGIIQCLKFFINTPITSVRKINTNNVRDEPVIHDVYDNVHAYFSNDIPSISMLYLIKYIIAGDRLQYIKMRIHRVT